MEAIGPKPPKKVGDIQKQIAKRGVAYVSTVHYPGGHGADGKYYPRRETIERAIILPTGEIVSRKQYKRILRGLRAEAAKAIPAKAVNARELRKLYVQRALVGTKGARR